MAQPEVDRKLEAATDESATLDRVVGRSSVDYLLRNAHQQLVQLSAQADLKASIMLTTSAVALSFAFSRGHSSYTRPSLIILELGIFAALVGSILVALPSLPIHRRRQPRHSADPDLRGSGCGGLPSESGRPPRRFPAPGRAGGCLLAVIAAGFTELGLRIAG